MEMLGNKNVSLDKGLVKDVFSEGKMFWQTDPWVQQGLFNPAGKLESGPWGAVT